MTHVIGAGRRDTYSAGMVGVSLVMDRVLPQRARARRWSNDGGAASNEATSHPGVEIAWIDGGGMRYRVHGESIELVAGDVMIVPCGVEHASEFMPRMIGGSVHLDDALLAQAADAAGVAAPDDAHKLAGGADVRVLGAMLVDELARGGADAQLCAAALVDALAVKAIRAGPGRSDARDPRVRTAVEFVRARFADDVDVDDIAAACKTSRFHLSRVFKAATGKSPYRFLIDVRLEESARLLRRGRPVTDAALSSGFTDLSRFARMFARRYGVLPRAYSSTAATSSPSMSPSPSRS